MNILISGGFGFIGSYLTSHLLDTGVNVGVVTRRVPDTFADLAQRVDCHIHNLSEPSETRFTRQYDCFVHLAGPSDGTPSTLPDAGSGAIDVTRHSLEMCRVNGIPRFVLFSTFQVYGRDHGFIDESTPVQCRNDYARAHRLAEEEVRRTARERGFPEYVILRPTNAYGFSQHTDVHRWSLVPSCFCRSAVAQREIVLKTSGHQQKDFIHLEDIAALTHRICLSFERFKNQTVNLASGWSHAIVEVAGLVQSIYERAAGTSCILRKLSDSPPCAEPLVVSRAKIADLLSRRPADQRLAAEITKTLSYLMS